jgi:hypothetical protein
METTTTTPSPAMLELLRYRIFKPSRKKREKKRRKRETEEKKEKKKEAM